VQLLGVLMTLEEIRDLVRSGRYHYSEKIRVLIEEGWYDERDLEACVLSATKFYKIEKDEQKTSIDGKSTRL